MHKPAVRLLNHRGGSAQSVRFRRSFWGGIFKRQREGIAIAKERGIYKGRKPIERDGFNEVVAIWRRGEITAAEAMRRLDMAASTFYRKVRRK